MVLLRPLFDGEHVKSCTGCGQVGLASPIPERSNFCPHRRVADPLLIRYEGRCRSCHRRRNRAYNQRHAVEIAAIKRLGYAARRAEMSLAEREVQRVEWRDAARRRLARDPKGERKRRAAAQVRREQARREMTAETKVPRPRARPRTELANGTYGVALDIRPFRAWLRYLMAQEDASLGGRAPIKALAARLGHKERTVWRWLNEGETIDEAIVDRATSREGSLMAWEVFANDWGCGVPERPERPECASPGCVKPHNGGRFCHEHTEQLARVREEYQSEGRLMSANGGAPKALSKARRSRVPTCCAPSCWAERSPGERFCDGCLADGWTEETYE